MHALVLQPNIAGCVGFDALHAVCRAVGVSLQMAVVALGTTKQPLPGFTGRAAAPKEHGEMGYNYDLAAAMPPVSANAS